jgi:hypothetical protein
MSMLVVRVRNRFSAEQGDTMTARCDGSMRQGQPGNPRPLSNPPVEVAPGRGSTEARYPPSTPPRARRGYSRPDMRALGLLPSWHSTPSLSVASQGNAVGA